MELHPGRGGAALMTVIVLASVGIVSGSTPQPDSLIAKVEAMNDSERIGFIEAMADLRDSTLQDFDVKIAENCTNVNIASGNRRFMFDRDFEERRLGSTLWMHLLEYEYYHPGKRDIRAEAIINWDGKRARGVGLPPYFRTDYAQCRIDGQENDNFVFRRYNELLGLRVQVEAAGMPFGDLLRKVVGNREAIAISTENSGGRAVIRVRITRKRSFDEWNFLISPSEGFMLVKVEYRYQIHESYNQHWEEALERRAFNGIWMPTKVIHRTGTSASPEESEITFNVESCKVGEVRPADVEVAFPVDSHVIDSTRGMAYTVLPDGKYRLLNLADPDKHILHVAATNPVTDNISSAAAAKLYHDEPLVLATPAILDRSAPPSRWRLWGAICSVIAAAIAGTTLWRGRLRRARAGR